ncbi:MAG: hypothetical protein H7Y11_06190 [Armatimonadetes bacterium]|nr:hypothetical protein [Anaerolineae bacterium]
MQTIKLHAWVDATGQLKLELPVVGLANRKLEMLIVMQPVTEATDTEAVDANGWPIGFFERTYGALADDPIERPAELPLDVRDEIE